jgi:PKD domain
MSTRFPWRTGFAVAAICAVALIAIAAIDPRPIHAQDQADGGMSSGGDMSIAPPPGTNSSASDDEMPVPIPKVRILQPINGSMMVAPPYGTSPLQVGFFVLADDPEGLGFLTYSWNFGDGTVSALPPELYIFHTYQLPGTYLCSLVIKTVDGRAKTFMQGVVVKAPGD